MGSGEVGVPLMFASASKN